MGRARATLTFAIQPEDNEIGPGNQRSRAGLSEENNSNCKKVDPALLGGVTAEMGGKTYDGSLTTRLAEAKQRLAG